MPSRVASSVPLLTQQLGEHWKMRASVLLLYLTAATATWMLIDGVRHLVPAAMLYTVRAPLWVRFLATAGVCSTIQGAAWVLIITSLAWLLLCLLTLVGLKRLGPFLRLFSVLCFWYFPLGTTVACFHLLSGSQKPRSPSQPHKTEQPSQSMTTFDQKYQQMLQEARRRYFLKHGSEEKEKAA